MFCLRALAPFHLRAAHVTSSVSWTQKHSPGDHIRCRHPCAPRPLRDGEDRRATFKMPSSTAIAEWFNKMRKKARPVLMKWPRKKLYRNCSSLDAAEISAKENDSFKPSLHQYSTKRLSASDNATSSEQKRRVMTKQWRKLTALAAFFPKCRTPIIRRGKKEGALNLPETRHVHKHYCSATPCVIIREALWSTYNYSHCTSVNMLLGVGDPFQARTSHPHICAVRQEMRGMPCLDVPVQGHHWHLAQSQTKPRSSLRDFSGATRNACNKPANNLNGPFAFKVAEPTEVIDVADVATAMPYKAHMTTRSKVDPKNTSVYGGAVMLEPAYTTCVRHSSEAIYNGSFVPMVECGTRQRCGKALERKRVSRTSTS
ncbi:uncharacterized protein LAESUDRAFT_711355 [Laetiporus sulphureus 93-53]|uniref:Uncharacterized protein n=1 Tax=Laetiporus sulphureus 93-53 TaxID=1314785 RepID=A0A165GX11_9APHY|nr:uncharacterized protein LAESUDRAFT_711355 [Laetiporus sulphureus 93-53]KZT10944.1 hypothetical protein LAESUDRAFT_711355 [Laetiporus sulphureus 93-53]